MFLGTDSNKFLFAFLGSGVVVDPRIVRTIINSSSGCVRRPPGLVFLVWVVLQS
jgi:hypothetical protein